MFWKIFVTLLVVLSCLNVLSMGQNMDQVYGIYTIFGGDDTETIVQTGMFDMETGNVTTLATNFVYAGGSITYDGISTFDQQHDIFHYATDFSSAFIWGVDVSTNELTPPIDFDSDSISDMKYNPNDDNLYVLFSDEDESILYASYSAGNGPATIVANFTSYLAMAGELGQGAISMNNQAPTPSNYYFVTYGSSGHMINVYNADTMTFSNATIQGDCGNSEIYFSYLQYNSSTPDYVWGIQLEIADGESNYYFSTVFVESGKCTIQKTGWGDGIATAFTYSPASQTIYYAYAPNGSPAQICYASVGFLTAPFLGKETCVDVLTVLTDIEVSYSM